MTHYFNVKLVPGKRNLVHEPSSSLLFLISSAVASPCRCHSHSHSHYLVVGVHVLITHSIMELQKARGKGAGR
jgi:hypothetical protein